MLQILPVVAVNKTDLTKYTQLETQIFTCHFCFASKTRMARLLLSSPQGKDGFMVTIMPVGIMACLGLLSKQVLCVSIAPYPEVGL